MNKQGSWIIGGTLLVGLGVGFFLLPSSPLFFVASILTGIGIGLVIAAFLPRGESQSTGNSETEGRSE